MGPMLPMLTEIEDAGDRRSIEHAARALRAKDEAYGGKKAAQNWGLREVQMRTSGAMITKPY